MDELGLEQRANLHLHVSMLGGVRDPPGKLSRIHVFSLANRE